MAEKIWNVLVTGGAGYVGSNLIPKLLDAGHRVTVLDLYIYGDHVFPTHGTHPNLRQVRGDLRDAATVKMALEGCDAVIHLACISNDPSFELNPELGRSINYDCFLPLVRAAKAAGVRRFIYASSSSVYGVKSEPEVTEDLSLEPLTDYSKYKAMCEDVLMAERTPGFVTTIIRPSTVCGYAPRQRLDVVVNIFVNHAVNNGRIKIFGGDQKRPNIHIDDMADLYVFLLQQEDDRIDGKIWNAGCENHTVQQLADIVKDVVGGPIEIDVQPTNDPRSYHVSSDLIERDLGFKTQHSIADAVCGLTQALKDGRLVDPMNNPLYFNIKRMQELHLA